MSQRAYLYIWFLLRLSDCQQYGSETMWNIIAGKSLLLSPADAGCDPRLPATYCVPAIYGVRLPAASDQCLPRQCRPENAAPTAMTDENTGTTFFSKTLANETLTITADLDGTFDVLHFRFLFSGNPPAAIIIRRRIDTGAWTDWRYFAVDCLSVFGQARYQTPAEGVLAMNQPVRCSDLPWTAAKLSSANSLVWQVLLDRPDPDISYQADSALLDYTTRASAVQIALGGHLLSLPSLGTTYGADNYGIAEIGVYGWCANGFYRPDRNSTRCDNCGCHIMGALNQTCTSLGMCACKGSFSGNKCDRCSVRFFNATAGCPPCDCDLLGTEDGVCDAESGVCRCRSGFTGARCGDCMAGSHLLGHVCVPCDCSVSGSAEGVCDLGGTCVCKRFVTGNKCDVCLDGFVDLSEANPNGCSLRPSPVLLFDPGQNQTTSSSNQPALVISSFDQVQNQTMSSSNQPALVFPSFDQGQNHTLSSRGIVTFNLTENGTSVRDGGSGYELVESQSGRIAVVPRSSSVVDGSVVYPWLIAITVLLIIALLIAVIHFILYIRRRSWHQKYSPRQVPEFLSVETTTKHPDYARRQQPERTSAKLTGYFYNPEYPLGALTPGLPGRRGTDTNRNHADYDGDTGNVDGNQAEEEVNTEPGAAGSRRRQIDLTREPAPTGVLPFRPHGRAEPRTADNHPISTISGGVVNENFAFHPEEI